MPAVAVVIPTLDEEKALPSCLVSVEEGADELVVSDGGSRDDTIAIVHAHPTARLVTGRAGRGAQLNAGADATSSPILLFVHADCRLQAEWRPALEEALTDREVSLASFHLHTEPAPGTRSTWLNRAWLRFVDLRSYGAGLPYGDQGFGVRRELFERLGGFPAIPLMEDFAFARACRREGRIAHLDPPIRTTARRFQRHPVRTRLMTATFPLLFRLGMSPWRLASWYRAVR